MSSVGSPFAWLLDQSPWLLALGMVGLSQLWSTGYERMFGRVRMSAEVFRVLYEVPLIGTALLVVPMSALEELFFRLLLVGVLGHRHLGAWMAVSVILFAVLHLGNRENGRAALLAWMLLSGAFLTFVYLRYGLLTAIGVHLLYNGSGLVGARIYYRLFPDKLAEARMRACGTPAIVSRAGAQSWRYRDPWELPRREGTVIDSHHPSEGLTGSAGGATIRP